MSSNNNLLILSIASPDFVTKYKRKDLLSQDLNGYFKKVHYVFLVEKLEKPYIEKINNIYTVACLSNKRYSWLQKGKLRHLNTVISLLYNLFYLWQYSIRNKISVFFVQEPFIRGSLAYMLSKLTGKPYVVEICSNYKTIFWDVGKLEIPILMSVECEQRLMYFILRKANIITADRDYYWKDNLIPHELENRYFRYNFSMEESHYSAPESRINLKEKYNATGKKVVLYIGRLIQEKRSEDLALVAKELFSNTGISDTVMWIVGDGPLRQYLMDDVANNRLSDKVLFIENQPTSMVANFLSTADVVIAPHAGWVIPECQLAETPIVLYDFDWHKEGVANGKYGIIVPYRDAKAMADSVKDVLLHPEKYKPMMKQARKWVLQNNTLEQEIKGKLKIYKTVLDE